MEGCSLRLPVCQSQSPVIVPITFNVCEPEEGSKHRIAQSIMEIPHSLRSEEVQGFGYNVFKESQRCVRFRQALWHLLSFCIGRQAHITTIAIAPLPQLDPGLYSLAVQQFIHRQKLGNRHGYAHGRKPNPRN
jgi:hypothetical protein